MASKLGVNLPPVADAGGPYMIDEGSPLVLNASGSTDPNGNETIVSFAWDLDNDGQFDDATGVNPTITSAQLTALGLPRNGPSSFPIALRVTDDGGLSAEDTATVSVLNLPPVAISGGPYTIDEGDSLALDASGSTDPGGNGTIVGFEWDLDNDGQFDDATGVNPILSPAQLAALGLPTNGPSSFPIALRVTDDGGLSAEDTTTVSIVNLPPVAVDDGVSVAAHQSINIDVLANDSDAEGDPLTVAQVTTPTNLGEVSINDDNTLRYRRHRRFGSDACDAFTYTISDGNGGFDTASVFVTVGSPTEDCGSGPGSSPPVADDQAVSTPQDTPVAITLTASDVDGDALTFAIVTGPTDGALSGTAPNVTYTPNAGFTGTDGFSFKANDGTVDSNIATVTIEVAAAPSPTGKVKGTVKKDGKRISGASVRLDPGTVSERQATTNKAGKFDFDSVPAGNHTITATDGVCGVGPFPILVTAGQTLTLDLFLVCP